jgi:IS30 family transposase
MLAKIRDNKTITVISALIRQARELPAELYKTLTWDRGAEMTSHTRFTVATDIQIYFCDPQSPWQRGSNENTNRLLRQYFPKGTDLSVHSQQRLNSVARQLNERPRKTLDYESPAERFNVCCVHQLNSQHKADVKTYSIGKLLDAASAAWRRQMRLHVSVESNGAESPA